MSLCKNCISGKHQKINGVDVYVATPAVEYPKDKAILFLPDVFGIEFINNKLLADDFARNGFFTVIPDYLNGDALEPDAMQKPGFNVGAWFANHGADKTRPPLDKVIAGLKDQGVKEFAAIGYCFGARYVFDLALENVIKASVVCHPSLIQVPADIEKYRDESKAPLLINSCTFDTQFPPEAGKKADEILGGGKFAPGYENAFWEGCTHGFAVRGDLSDPKVKAGKEGAFKNSVEWFIKHF